MNKNNMMTNNQYKWSVHLILIQKKKKKFFVSSYYDEHSSKHNIVFE